MATIKRVYYELVGVDRASAAFGRAGRAATIADTKMARLGRSLHIAGVGLAVTAGAVAAESIKMATSFQAAMTRINTQAGASTAEMERMSKAVLKLGQYAQQSPQELANSLFHLESVGLRGAKAMRALKTSADLAAVGGANLEDTTNALAGAWRSGIKGAGSFRQAAGTLNAIIGAGNMQMQDLVDALSTGILPAARTFGLSLKQVGSALALLTDEGIPAQLAATRLRMALSLLAAPSQAADKQLSQIGLTGLQLAQAMRSPGGLVAAIALLKKHLDASGLSAAQEAQILSRAFGGGRQSSAILTLINNLEVLRRKQKQINDTTSRYGKAVAAQRQTAQAQFALLKSSLDVLAVKLGTTLLPLAVGLVKAINNQLLPAAVNFAHTFARIIPVDQIKKDWNAVLRFFGVGPKPKPVHVKPDYTKTLGGMAARMVATAAPPMQWPQYQNLAPPGMAGRLMTAATPPAPKKAGTNLGSVLGSALSKALLGLTSHLGQFAQSLIKVFSKLDWVNIGKQIGGNAIGFALGFLSNLGADLFSVDFWKKHWLDAIIGVLSLVGIGKLGGVIARFLEHIPILRLAAPFFRSLEHLSNPIFKAGGKILKALGEGILDGIRTVLPHSGESIAKWLELLPIRLGLLAIKFQELGLKLLLGLGKGILSAARFIGRIIGRIIGWLLKPWIKAGAWLIRAGTDLLSGLFRGILGRWSAVWQWVSGVRSRIIAALPRPLQWLINTGSNIVTGLLRGIVAKMAGIWGWIRRVVVDPIISAVKHFFGIKSPSTIMHGIGFNLIAGLLRGIIAHNPVTTITRIFGGLPAALGHVVSKGLVALTSLPGRAMRALGGLGSKAWGWLSHLFGGGGGAGQWAGIASRVLAMLGQPASALGVVLRQIATESGGNPKAINLWDINARLGHPSKGLMQVIDPTFAAYAGPFRGLGIWNPLANIYAGVNYAIHRYGASGWMSVLGQGHGYKTGSWSVPATGPALIHRGEMVLPERLASAVRGALSSPGQTRSGGPLVNIEHVHVQDRADVELLARRIAFGLGI